MTEKAKPERLAVVSKVKCPPGGWNYTDPETGARFHQLSYRELIRQVSAYMEANSIPKVDGWRLMLDDEICRQNEIEDTHCGQPEKPRPIAKDRKLGPADLLGFLKTVRQWSSKGFSFVDREEAERRAAICATCPHNIEVPGCSGCLGILSYVRETLHRRANHRGLEAKITELDDQLKNCEVCGCVLEVKVHLPMEVATYVKPPGGRIYPSHCWMQSAEQQTKTTEKLEQ